ncbi:MAG: ABC transporter ATP-binding protein/permease [Clostridia bacterium]|nr:ABC transporter ATP-binding protein/permease [Clostridia bacterium]
MLKRFIAYYRPHRKMFILDMSASMLVSLIGMVYPEITRKMLGDLIPQKKFRAVIIAGLCVLVLYIIRLFLRYFVQYYGHLIGVGMQAQMRRDLFTQLQKLPFSFYDEHETGKIMTRMTSDLFEVSELAHHGPENLIISSVMLVGSFIYLCTIDVWLTMIVFACVPILIVVSMHYRKKMRDAFSDRRQSNAIINGALESSISGIRVTKAYTNSDKEMEKFEKGNNAFIDACKKAYMAMAKYHAGSSFITDIFNVIILIAGGIFLYEEYIDFADYSAFIVSVNLFINPITTLIGFMEQYQDGVSGFERFVEIMDLDPEPEKPDAEDIGEVNGKIELNNVEFSYETSGEVLHGVTLSVERGKTLALVGPSGGGKTTICHLIPRFYRVSGGEILIDGKNIEDVTMTSLRRNIGIVQQDVFLFNGSIRDNILYGRLDATDDEVIEAAKRANIHDWVMTLEKGYDTEIGERGVKLSGGQKQRLSIARVFLKDPAVLILDEATSALDNTTEILIQQALDELCRGRTTIVVAHRLSTIRRADEIAVISAGRVAERGTHEELMKDPDGIYARLYKLQFRDADSEICPGGIGKLAESAGF